MLHHSNLSIMSPNVAVQTPTDRAAFVPAAISVQANTRSQSLAVADRDLEMNFKELEDASNAIAARLETLGVTKDVVVGLYLPRSLGTIVAALGIMKAGGAYLPIDPSSPASRVKFEFNDAGVGIVITNQKLASKLPSGNWSVTSIDDRGRIADEVEGNRLRSNPAESGHLAYVIYTSGSTGTPKGVEITHGALENLIRWHNENFNVTQNDRATHQASPGFDAAVWEVWPYLVAGASVLITDDETRTDPELFRNWLVESATTITFAPTPMAERLIQLQWPANAKLHTLLTGSDTLRRYPHKDLPFKLVNNYGPTECTVVTTSGDVPSGQSVNRLPSIGRPITNMQVFILDEQLRHVPTGVTGNIYIGGVGLARGYRNRPDLTSERFISNPFSNDPSARLYKTGDLGSFSHDGNIHFVGRSDNQAKIRGYRVEPDEVAAALDRYPGVDASVVITRDKGDENELVAYVVAAKKDEEPTEKLLREFLLESLPEYMVPAAFYRLEKIPLNSSGKIDRIALSSLQDQEVLRRDDHVAPRSPVEERLAAMLSTLLRVDKISVTDNFFLLGGNSLLGAQVIARVRDAFGVELSLLSLFEHPTIQELSSEVEGLLLAKLQEMSEEEAVQLLNPAVPQKLSQSSPK
ncbi:MAG: Peptide synthetase [Acidobacteriales bacterium]|nr:Peptide synthetase [Terriglobales bacterium]